MTTIFEGPFTVFPRGVLGPCKTLKQADLAPKSQGEQVHSTPKALNTQNKGVKWGIDMKKQCFGVEHLTFGPGHEHMHDSSVRCAGTVAQYKCKACTLPTGAAIGSV